MSNTNADTNAASTPSFIAALVTAGITVGVFTGIWLVMHGRRVLDRVFQPRVILAPEAKRPEPLPSSPFSFWKDVFVTPDKAIIVANGVDAYLFVRYLKVFGLHMLVPYVILSFAVCIPISVVEPTSGQTGLNRLTFGNVPTSAQTRHVGHFLVAIILMAWTLFLLWREYNHFVEIRQEWLSSTQHQSLARTRTVAIANLPESVNSESAIKELGGVVSRLTGPHAPRPSNVTDGTVVANGNNSPSLENESGGIRQVWLAKNVKEVESVWEDRDKEVMRLEAGSSKLAKLAAKNQKKGKTPEKEGTFDAEQSHSIADRYVLPKKRPSWKQGLLGLIGKKMTLESSPEFIREKNAELERLRADEGSLKLGNTAFVRFGSQTEAHAFARLISSTDKKHRSIDSSVEVVPEDVQWTNTSMSAAQRKIRTAVSWALTIGLIIVWAIPVAFVGAVSNVDALCQQASWLAWVCQIPEPALAIIKGVLPPALLAVLFMLLPVVLRLMVRLQGVILKSRIELKLFSRFWLFQVIHGFLIVTLSSGLISALANIDEVAGQAPTLLAEKLPNASIFFLTFILVSTFTAAAKAYSRAIPTALWALRFILAGNTPRKTFLKKYSMDKFAWATTWPPICLLICICIVYSVIQPVMTLLTMVAFIMLYAAHKYLLFWVADQPDSLETGGLFYIKALRTVFVALYLEGICLAGLFFLLPGENGGRSTTGLACGALMVVMIVIVAAFQTYIDWFRFKNDYLVFAHSSTTVKHSLAKTSNEIVGQAQYSAGEEAEIAGPELGNTSGFHERAFDHPALWKKQPTVWLADDLLGIGKSESARINDAGVESSTEYATMDEKGRIEVTRGPPDEAWYGGQTAQ